MNNRSIAVLGMHRSGTSCLTGTLEEAGVYLGPVSRSNPYNLKGNHERLEIMHLHEEVLAANAVAWDRPPSSPPRWSSEHRERLRAIIDSYREHPVWAFKDPRTLVLIDAWREAVPGLEFAGIFRHPALVARSLAQRGGMTFDAGVALWVDYNQRLLALHEERAFPLMEFSSDGVAVRTSLGRMLRALRLAEPGELQFYTPSLQNQRRAEDELPGEPMELYRDLRARVT